MPKCRSAVRFLPLTCVFAAALLCAPANGDIVHDPTPPAAADTGSPLGLFAVAFADESTVIAVAADGELRWRNTADGKTLAVGALPDQAEQLCAGPGGVVITAARDTGVDEWQRPAPGGELVNLRHFAPPGGTVPVWEAVGLRVSPNGALLALATVDEDPPKPNAPRSLSIRIWKVADGSFVRVEKFPFVHVRPREVFSPDG